jgi:hypothetical protein
VPRRTVTVWPKAEADIGRLHQDDPSLSRRALAIVKLLEAGHDGEPLNDMVKYGDLSDCRKWYFGAEGRPQTTHRLVYQQSSAGGLEVLEVIAVEGRPGGYVYLLVADRLGRIPKETEPELNRLHQEKIAERAQRRRRGRPARS